LANHRIESHTPLYIYVHCTAEHPLFICPVIRFSSPCTCRFPALDVASLICLAQVA